MPIKHRSALPTDTLRVFETLPHPYLILSKELFILTASQAYLQLIGKVRAQLFEKYLFDVFPKVPEWSTEEGGIAFSLAQAIETGKPHRLPITRFDIPDPDNAGRLLERYWDTAHTPVLDNEGYLCYIIHHTQDVTEQVLAERNLKASLEKEKETAAKATRLSLQMEKLFEEMPAQIAVVTGPDLVYEFINPQYEKELFPGRKVLGKPLLMALPEVAGLPVWESLQQVYKTGETFAGNEICIPLAQEIGGIPEDHYFNFICQALRDEKGNITGVLSFKYDITELVLARKRLEQTSRELQELNEGLSQANEEIQVTSEEIQSANEELSATNEELYQAQQSLLKLNDELEERVELRTLELQNTQTELDGQNERLTRFFMQAPAGICVIDGPDFVFELVNPPYQQLFPGRELTGKPLLEALPELKNHAVYDILKNVYETGNTFEGKELLVPLARTPDGPIEDRYFTFIYQARYDVLNKIDGILVFVFEVTDEVRIRQKEAENEQRFRFLLNAIPQQVWTARPNGKLDYVNEVICNDFGQDAQTITDRGWQQFIHTEDLQTCLKKWLISLKTGQEYLVEFRLKFHDGQYHWHLARAVPLIENGEIKLWLGTNTNIDLQKNNEQKKDEFLSIASHELKTPLTSIKAFNQLMLRINDPQKLTGFIQKSASHVLRLEKLINDLLDVSRINAGKMVYNMETFNFREMLIDTIDAVQHTTSSHLIILENSEDIAYTGDRFRLEQVMNNLLSNAIKYSPQADKVIVNCVVRIEDNSIVVSVRDWGIGIEEKNLTRLFERYYRVDNTAMRFEGLGLGLFISAEILKRHNGSFWIESKPDEGSTFFFRLLLDPSKKTEPIINEDDHYQDSSITLSYNRAHERIDADWTGFQNLESVQQGCLRMMEMLVKHKVQKVLNNNTYVLGNWSEAADWGAQEWFPAMEKAGMRYFAWVNSPSVFSQLSARKSADSTLEKLKIHFFTEVAAAVDWLNEQ
ncbi:PAS domain-containing protein [Mucilaginibacter aquaedulcis]|uniref:PAS domain-containing protein n=1 Tax=Mucilaginibacter aquaedulcis TaxID=1187081 RepID=UPI0025B3FF45|nr:PAS domain-containing protein [Mucilaginibacter aquaedulcis]MDN3547474.1 PAS domain-containing protein [Mucilaginibacter aquaedulcis]